MGPTLAGFIAWAQTSMQITTAMLPSNSMWYPAAFNNAMRLVDKRWCSVSVATYTEMVYNLGGSNLINFAQDPDNAPIFKDQLPFFEYYRQKYDILGPVTGVIQSASDQGTSGGLVIPPVMQQLTLGDLQKLKDPWGRVYLSYAQEQGSLWGLS